ncbi:MAG: elongation factor P [bacterium]
MISTADFRNGMSIELEGDLYSIVEFQHHKPGKGGAVVRTKLKNFKTGAIMNKTFRAGEKVEQAIIEKEKKQYLYNSGDTYYFMDLQTYEQVPLDVKLLGDSMKFLKENMEIEILVHNASVIGAELPTFVDLKVTYTEPGLRGDRVSNASKPATLETGTQIQVPLFVEIGDLIRIDTRTGEYSQRA